MTLHLDFNGRMGNRGVTLVELIVVISVIAIIAALGLVSLSGSGLTASTKARSNAEDLRQYLNYARIAAIGNSSDVLIAFGPSQKLYYGCFDTDNSDDCTASEQAAFSLAKPDEGSNGSGGAVRGVKLRDDTEFGTFSSARTDVPQKTLLGGAPARNAQGIFYMDASSTNIPAGGIISSLSSPTRMVFRRNGTSTGGTAFIYLKKDDETSFHYAVNVTSRGKVDLYQWALVDNVYRWKLVSTR